MGSLSAVSASACSALPQGVLPLLFRIVSSSAAPVYRNSSWLNGNPSTIVYSTGTETCPGVNPRRVAWETSGNVMGLGVAGCTFTEAFTSRATLVSSRRKRFDLSTTRRRRVIHSLSVAGLMHWIASPSGTRTGTAPPCATPSVLHPSRHRLVRLTRNLVFIVHPPGPRVVLNGPLYANVVLFHPPSHPETCGRSLFRLLAAAEDRRGRGLAAQSVPRSALYDAYLNFPSRSRIMGRGVIVRFRKQEARTCR